MESYVLALVYMISLKINSTEMLLENSTIVLKAQRGIPYNRSVDMWSAGVILFILLGGYPPFFDDDEVVMFHKIRRGEFSFNDGVWSVVSDR